MSGIELHDWMLTNRPARLVRFAFITGDIASAGVAALTAGTRQLVREKPFELPALLEVVEKIRRLRLWLGRRLRY